MDAAFTAEQDEIRRTLRELLPERCGPDEMRGAVRTPDGYDANLWRRLAQHLGLPGLALPEIVRRRRLRPHRTRRSPARRRGAPCCPRRCSPPPYWPRR